MSQSIETVLTEDRSFPPPDAFRDGARISDRATYDAMWRRSVEDPEGFFGEVARELPWLEPFDSVLDWSGAPVARWFGGGKLNVSHVCLDHHVEAGRGDDVALMTLAQTLCREGDSLDRVDARVAREALVRCMDARAPPSRAATAVRGETWRECAAAAATLDPRSPVLDDAFAVATAATTLNAFGIATSNGLLATVGN